MSISDLEGRPWWGELKSDIKELLRESVVLLVEARRWDYKFHDYSFVVFPAAKAYEGFLKGFFLSSGLISKKDYYGRHFRIGKALNPDLEERYKNDDWVYERLSKYCGGPGLPRKLWDTWRKARNLVFHWFPEERNAVDLREAEDRVEMVIGAIDEIHKSCGVGSNKKL